MKIRFKVYIILLFLFLASGSIALYFVNLTTQPEKIAADIQQRLSDELEKLTQEAEDIIEELQRNPAYDLTPKHDHSFYLVEDFRLTRWSDHRFVPMMASVSDDFIVKLLREGNSDYIARKWQISRGRFLVGVISLYRKYPITNHYLKPEWNEHIFPQGKITILDASSESGFPICVESVCPFKVTFHSEDLRINTTSRILTVIFIFSGVIVFFLLFFELLIAHFIPDIVFVLVLLMAFVVRLIMTSLDFPSELIGGELFNPLVFASSSLNASLGDLLLNEVALFLVCFFLFKNFFHFKSVHFLKSKRSLAWFLSVFSALMVMFAMLFPFVVIQTLYNNSAIELSIADNLNFDALRIASIIAVVLSGVCAFLFSHCFIRLLIGDGNKLRIFLSFISGLALFILINSFSGQLFMSSAFLALLYFLIVYLLDLTGSLKRLSFTTFTYLFVSIFSLALNGAYAMHYFSRQEKMTNMFRFGRNYLIDRDYFAEYLLGELSTKISGDVFIQSRIATPFLSKDAVKQKIRQFFLPSYFNKYDVELYTFNPAGEASDNHSGLTLKGLLDNYNQETSRTDYEGVYFMNSPAADVSQKYLVVIPIAWMKAVAGHVVMEFSLKKVIPENVYPELLVDNRFLETFRAQEISYGVFINNKLSYSSGSFNYETLFNPSWFGYPELHISGISRNDYDHIADEDDAGRIAIVSSRSTPLSYSIANFSFLLVIGLGTILIFLFLHSVISFWEGGKLYFAARIQLFLNLAFFLPLIIVSIMSLRVTNRTSENQINEEYLNRTRRFSEQVSGELHKNLIYSFEPLSSFSNQLTDLALLTNLDANVYYVTGNLLATSQPLIFENKLLSEYLNPSAYSQIKQGNNLFIEVERLGSLEYFTAYAALKAPSSGALIGIAGVPFFQSEYSAEKIQINILSNILNIFALIFIVLVALSYFVTRWLTFPLTFITQSLRKTSLTKTNQPLVWKADDEIGLMVKEYNQMLFSLSESKAELEQTQREMAWRDMAQQVAHEIKNPLTPMKLTLQQLERSLENGKAGPDKIQKAISSLLVQVNTLNDIASSFSSFAKMPEPVMRPLEVTSLLKRIIDLHSHSGDLRIESSYRELWVNGDEQLLGRTFSNLILNALQSAMPGEVVRVIIRVEVTLGKVLITIQDNGKGIQPEVAERIFIPHFTTKKSGSGLGLAIARQAIEQMQGKLWFTTQVGKGSEFFLELPLIERTDE